MPSEPQDLRAWNRSGYSIEVSWKKPLNINGILKGYKVCCSILRSVHCKHQHPFLNKWSTVYLAPGLLYNKSLYSSSITGTRFFSPKVKCALYAVKFLRRRDLRYSFTSTFWIQLQGRKNQPGLAQSLECLTAERKVAGSIPKAGPILRVLK